MLLSLALWIQSTEFFSSLRYSSFVYPVVMSLHLAGIAIFGGMILISDLRLLGVMMTRRPLVDVVDPLRMWKRIGFLIVATCGILMLGSKAEEYYYNVFFRTKVVLFGLVLVHALVFRRSVYDRMAEFDKTGISGRAKLAAALSLVLWTGIVIAGRGIGYIQPPEGIHAERAPLHASALQTQRGATIAYVHACLRSSDESAQ